MDVGRRRAGTRNGVVSGSVWESRMKIDEVKGGIKVFNGEDNSEEGGAAAAAADDARIQVYRRSKRNQIGGGGASGKRKTWKSESFEGFDKTPIQIAKARSDLPKNSDEQCRELSVSVDGIKKSPTHLKKTRSDVANKELSFSFDGLKKTIRSESLKGSGESTQLRKANKVTDESLAKGLDGSVEGIEKTRSDEGCKEVGVCEDKVISSSLGNVGHVKSAPKLVVSDEEDGDEVEEEEEDEEIDNENKSFDIKEINVPEEKPKKVVNDEKKIHQVHEKPIPISSNVNKQPPPPEKPKKVVNNEKKIHPVHEKPIPISSNVNKQPPPPPPARLPIMNHTTIYPNLTKPTPIPVSDEFQRIPETQNKLQNLVDLVMWRDVSKSAFVFGIGTFIIISSSYTEDLNINMISVISYLGLVYLAAIFLYRSIICRGAIDIDYSSQDYVVGEEEAIWVLELVLPYLNEFLFKLRGLFSGDPATTMKLAVLLFVLARCGSSITLWKMAKLGFFGVFTVPKVCSSYSTQLTGFGKFWIRRFRDAWESCSHKKAVAAAIFTLVWNLSSIVARIWAVFMLFVAVRYYQQSLMSDDWVVVEDEAGVGGVEDSRHGQRQRRGPTLVEVMKEKKGS